VITHMTAPEELAPESKPANSGSKIRERCPNSPGLRAGTEAPGAVTPFPIASHKASCGCCLPRSATAKNARQGESSVLNFRTVLALFVTLAPFVGFLIYVLCNL